MSLRRFLLSLADRALPPWRPSATAAGFFRRFAAGFGVLFVLFVLAGRAGIGGVYRGGAGVSPGGIVTGDRARGVAHGETANTRVGGMGVPSGPASQSGAGAAGKRFRAGQCGTVWNWPRRIVPGRPGHLGRLMLGMSGEIGSKTER